MASLTTLARPYGRAAFDAANSANALADWERALDFSAHVAGHEDVRRLLGHPAVERESMAAVFAPESSPEGFERFLTILAENGRLGLLPQIAEIFSELKDASEQTVAVTVTTATATDQAFHQQLKNSLEARFGRKVELDVETDESLIGGARIQAGDTVIDGSVRGKLERMRSALAG